MLSTLIYHIIHNSVCHGMGKVDSYKDLAVTFDKKTTFSEHIQEKINKAYSMLGIIKRNFIHMNKHIFTFLYKCMVRPHVEYANSIWNPFRKRDI